MKYIDWNEEKNTKLKSERGVGFEDIVTAIQENRLIKTLTHPNKKKYPNQKIMVIDINSYAYIVPFVEDEEKIFLKTIYPSKKYTKKYLE